MTWPSTSLYTNRKDFEFWAPKPHSCLFLHQLNERLLNFAFGSEKYNMSVTLHTSLGDLKLEVFCEEVPRTAENFLALAASGYYDGTIFHRNIKGFMIQGGDPTGTGKGGKSIYATPNGKFEDEIRPDLKHHKRGIVSMANSGPNTNGSQFFITYKGHPHLDGKYSIFGQVIDGMDTLDKMEKVPVGQGDLPLQDMKLHEVTIHANPIAR